MLVVGVLLGCLWDYYVLYSKLLCAKLETIVCHVQNYYVFVFEVPLGFDVYCSEFYVLLPASTLPLAVARQVGRHIVMACHLLQ